MKLLSIIVTLCLSINIVLSWEEFAFSFIPGKPIEFNASNEYDQVYSCTFSYISSFPLKFRFSANKVIINNQVIQNEGIILIDNNNYLSTSIIIPRNSKVIAEVINKIPIEMCFCKRDKGHYNDIKFLINY